MALDDSCTIALAEYLSKLSFVSPFNAYVRPCWCPRLPYASAVVSWLRSEQIDSRLAPDTVDSRHQEGLMNLDRRNCNFNSLAFKPTSCFTDIENLTLIHQDQEKFIRNSVVSTIRTIPLFPWAMTLNALCGTDTNKTIHRDHQFIVVPDPSWAACDGCLQALARVLMSLVFGRLRRPRESSER
ncbi:hypothetical protein PS710_00547 [Pseudomonas fluorescens]|uniref:Uncharacterized protein n=1 Tax=Pseudomonas fluorescens TaxID=294 RepID=A0A5E7A7N5_PSEFL|nr:hypothetical protein PS710_00547 [Pseudomonas fluorescens]